MFKALCPLVLASASPRRRALLQALGLHFICRAPALDESALAHETPDAFVLRMAACKAEAVARSESPEACIIAADTVVAKDGRILGKPKDSAEALAFLKLLNGQHHTVFTGFCVKLVARGFEKKDCVASRVHFGLFDHSVLAAYVKSGEPLDKAGAYGLQGLGSFLVAAVDGSSTNVIGLPVEALTQILLQEEIISV